MGSRILLILALLAATTACGQADDGGSAAAPGAEKQSPKNPAASVDPANAQAESGSGKAVQTGAQTGQAAKDKAAEQGGSKSSSGGNQRSGAWPNAARAPAEEKSAPATDGSVGQVQVNAPESAAPVFDAQFRNLEDWESQSLSKWKGQYVVLNFWATWCKSCQHEVPELDRLYDEFKDDNAVVVGIAIDNADKVRDYLEKYDINYPVLVGGDEALALSKEMGNSIEGLPYTIVITPEGKVVEAILGATEKGTLPRVLTPILKKG